MTTFQAPAICIEALDPGRRAEAEILAQALRLPLIECGKTQGFSFALSLTAEHIEVRSIAAQAQGPVFAELNDGDIHRRVRGGRRQTLARACGLHKEGPRRVLDATAGLGRDSTVLAGLGCEVTMLERSPVIAALLSDGLARASSDPACGLWMKDRIHLLVTDAVTYMLAAAQSPSHEVVYLDPMYPGRGKSALAKKEMRVLRALAGDDEDAGLLLEAALRYALVRVVVKRPPKAASLGGRVADHSIEGNRARYDIYFTRKLKPASA